jgi:hypothetical protein
VPTAEPTSVATPDLSRPPVVTATERDNPAGREVYGLDWLDGWIGYGTDDGRAGVWRLASADGGWTSGPIDPPFIPLLTGTEQNAQSFWVGAIVRIDSGLVAVGSKRVGCCDYVVPAIWTSPDGSSWEYHDQAGSAWFDAAHVPGSAVVNAAGEIVAASSAQLGSVSSIWISSDGLQWVEHPPQLQAFTSMYHLAAGTTNLMAIGEWHAEASQSARAWISADGREWSQLVAPPDAMAFDAIAYDATEDRYFIAGRTADGIALWITHDGTSWSDRVDVANGAGMFGDLEIANGILAGVAFEGGYASGSLVAISAWAGDLRSLTQITLADGSFGSAGSIGLEPGGTQAIVHAELLATGSDQLEPREWVLEIAGR